MNLFTKEYLLYSLLLETSEIHWKICKIIFCKEQGLRGGCLFQEGLFTVTRSKMWGIIIRKNVCNEWYDWEMDWRKRFHAFFFLHIKIV